jgi:FkbM family methyltransferase
MIKGTITPPKFSEHDKWYWKQYSCIEATKENYEYFVWIDGDVVVNYNIDTIQKYFPQIENYPISDTHIQDEFFGFSIEDGVSKSQLFNERLSTEMNITRANPPVMHVCMYIFNKRCDWWFEEIIKTYNSIDLSRYKTLLLWNDEGIDNLLRWKYGYKKHLPVSNFDTSSYDGDYGYSNATLRHFYKFWNEEGPQNFNRIYGWEFIPKDKSTILYFHGNKDLKVADKMIEFIKMKRDNSFYDSHYFYTDEYTVENLGEIWQIEGGTMEIAQKYGWKHAIYHEIYNLMDYYNNREKVIKDGDVVVDIGANMGVFNRWAYTQGASQVISFEPDKRYYKLLKLNADPRSILFNSAIADVVGTITLHESSHFGGSNVFWTPDDNQGYPVRCYSLDYFFSANIFDHIDFLKLDIEGAEQLAFKGISDDNLMKVKNIAMEYHHSHLQFNEEIRTNLITRLNKLGFNSHILFLGPDTSLQLIYFTR